MEDSITTWIGRLKEGDARSAEKIWDAYFEKLVTLARIKLNDQRRRDFDEEDVALSAFHSFFRAVDLQRLPKLDDRLDLWKVLVVITARKVSARKKYANTRKRGAGIVRGESIFFSKSDDDGDGLQNVLGTEPTPEVAAEVAETFEQMMLQLPDTMMRQVAQLKLEGYSKREIAEQVGCVERTVERKLERIRAIWTKPPPVELSE